MSALRNSLIMTQKLQPLELLLEPKRNLQRVSLYPPFCVGETMDEVNTVYILLFGSGLRLIANWGFIVNQQPADVSRLLIGGHSSTKTSYWLIKIETSLPTTEVNWTSLDIHLITRPIKRKNEKLSKHDLKILLAKMWKRLHWLAVKKYLYKEFCSILFCSTTEMI